MKFNSKENDVSSLYSSTAFHEALKTIISNIPEPTASIDIRLRPDEAATMEAVVYARSVDGVMPLRSDGSPVIEHKKFVLVEEEEFRRLRGIAP
jgi:hypothetical protein